MSLSARRNALKGAVLALAFACAWAGPGAAAQAVRQGAPATREPATVLDWRPCDDGFECATATVPRDYRHPGGATVQIAVIRHPATEPSERVGSLFVNPGGPGGSGVDLVRAEAQAGLANLNRRFDLIGFDPRGVGASRPAVRCLTDDEAKAQFAPPYPRPETIDLGLEVQWASAWVSRCIARNRTILPYLATANVARDLDLLRAAVGDRKLTYLGFSYGTLLGATYAALFRDRVRALVLDGPVDPDVWLNRPLEATQEQLAAFERALHRFFVACARGTLCTYGGDDPEGAFEELVARLDQAPVFADPPYDRRPVTGDTALVAAAEAMDSEADWPLLAGGLIQAERGRGTLLRAFADEYWGIDANGAYDGFWDRNLAISALDQRFPRRLQLFAEAHRHSSAMFPHFGWASGYLELPWGLYPVQPQGAYRGPFRMPATGPPALVIGTTYDPATPYAWAKRMTAQLGNAQLLTLVGDGHTAYFNYSSCVRSAVAAYVERGELPAQGTRCHQDLASATRRERTVPVAFY
jgi:pimeloyl-ACP methyl ester carboxylesterase